LEKKIIVIGAGFAGLSAASFLAKAGHDVTVLEKHNQPGGRARQFKAAGFTFDMGPSWYWMPDVFERYFKQFGKNVSDYYKLERLDPSYRIYWNDGPVDIPADFESFKQLFETIEPGSGEGDLSWLHAKILGEAGPCVVKDRSCASSLGVAAVRIADTGALEFGHQVHDLWERRRSCRVIQEESGWRHRTKATGTPAFRRGGPHHGVGRSR
jgi:hypothetical protein